MRSLTPRKQTPNNRTCRGSRTVESYLNLPERNPLKYSQAASIIASLLEHPSASLAEVSRLYEVDPRTVKRWVKPALRKVSGRYKPSLNNDPLHIVEITCGNESFFFGLSTIERVYARDCYEIAIHAYADTGFDTFLNLLNDKEIRDSRGRRLDLQAVAGILRPSRRKYPWDRFSNEYGWWEGDVWHGFPLNHEGRADSSLIPFTLGPPHGPDPNIPYQGRLE